MTTLKTDPIETWFPFSRMRRMLMILMRSLERPLMVLKVTIIFKSLSGHSSFHTQSNFSVLGGHDMSGQLKLLYPPSAIQQYFPCPSCGKVFTTPGSLRNHHKVHSGVTHCRICGKQLATVSSLNRHIKKEHKSNAI